METFQNGATGLYARSHAQKVWKEGQEPVPIHHLLMEQIAQEITQSKKFCDQGQCPGTIMFLWFWVYTDHLKIYFTFFKCYNVRVCWQEVNGAYHRQETMFEEEIVKSCQPALYKLHPLKRIRII